MKVTIIDKKIRMSAEKAMRYQILTWCFLNNKTVSKTDIDQLIVVMKLKDKELKSLCTNQSVRNSLNMLSKAGLIEKIKKYNKTIKINPELILFTQPPYIINYKIGINETIEG